VDMRTWTPIRWPCGPLEIERGSRREGFSPDERDALEQWGSPRMLERLVGTPFNCLAVTWAGGTPSDESQQRSLGPLISAAREAGLAVVGEVGQGTDLRKAAAAAESAGLRALCTESPEPLEGFPVLRFGEPSVGDRSPRTFLGVTGLPWPGLKVNLDEGMDASTGPTGPPWIDSNAWFVRLANELIRPETTWLSFEPPEEGCATRARPTSRRLPTRRSTAPAGWSRWTPPRASTLPADADRDRRRGARSSRPSSSSRRAGRGPATVLSACSGWCPTSPGRTSSCPSRC